jgi:hypothetical protein
MLLVVLIIAYLVIGVLTWGYSVGRATELDPMQFSPTYYYDEPSEILAGVFWPAYWIVLCSRRILAFPVTLAINQGKRSGQLQKKRIELQTRFRVEQEELKKQELLELDRLEDELKKTAMVAEHLQNSGKEQVRA